VVASNAILLVAACSVTVLVLAPRKISSVAVDEALVLAGSLALVALINIVLVRRAVAPLQAVNALARRVDLANPGERIPAAKPTSEAGELALTFNEMLTRLELERLESTRRVLAAHESERLRIAQELHDEIGQSLTAVLLQLGRVRARLPAHLKDELDDAQEAARDSLEGVRRIAIELRPETLDDLGLQDIQPELPQLSREAELVVYRVAQEALTNVARHSGSGTAELTVAADEQTLTLSIRDHGRGLPVGSVTDGNGVRGKRERAGLVGAELRLGAPAAGEGTELRLTLPLESAA
jgi:two-component system sensor histidine kinase UhpB